MKNYIRQALGKIIVLTGLAAAVICGGCGETQAILTPEELARKQTIALQVSQQLEDNKRQQQMQKQEFALKVSQSLEDYNRQHPEYRPNVFYTQPQQPDFASQLLLGLFNGNGLTSNVATYEWMKRN